jgi:SAM-dependent methyltransferase
VPRPSAEPFRATLGRSVRLLQAFRHEQPDPPRFYTALAEDSAAQVGHYEPLEGRLVFDVGGGPGYFRDAFRAAGARYLALDSDVGELSGLGGIASGTVVGSGMQLPLRTGCVDVCYSSNVLEHVPAPWTMAAEMVRVTRPGGLVFISYTVWFGPWGGHETSPWHFLGGRRARRRYTRTHGHEPKNKFGESLFAVTVADGLRWAREQQVADVVHLIPRYNPWWSRWLLRVPVVRELVTWNLVLVLRKR